MRNEAPAILEKIIEKYEILFSHEHLAKLNRKQGDKARAERRELEIARLKQEIREDFSLLRLRAREDGWRTFRHAYQTAEEIAESTRPPDLVAMAAQRSTVAPHSRARRVARGERKR